MNEIVEKKIPALKLLLRVLFSLKLPAPMFSHLDFIAQNGQNIKWRGIF